MFKRDREFLNVSPVSAADEYTDDLSGLDSLLDNMPGNDDGTDDPDNTDDDNTDDTGEDDDDPDNADDDPDDQAALAEQQRQAAQQQYAWAEMNKQNKQLMKMLGNMAQAQGIEFKSNKELLEKMGNASIEQLSKKNGVPVELMQELEVMRNDTEQWKQERAQQQAEQGFAKIATDYGLTQKELLAFADELDQKGLNPFTQSDVNVEATYKQLHMEEIIEKRVAAAVEKALKRSDAADTHSSVPNKKQGSGNGGKLTEKVDTVSKLNELLNGVTIQ